MLQGTHFNDEFSNFHPGASGVGRNELRRRLTSTNPNHFKFILPRKYKWFYAVADLFIFRRLVKGHVFTGIKWELVIVLE